MRRAPAAAAVPPLAGVRPQVPIAYRLRNALARTLNTEHAEDLRHCVAIGRVRCCLMAAGIALHFDRPQSPANLWAPAAGEAAGGAAGEIRGDA